MFDDIDFNQFSQELYLDGNFTESFFRAIFQSFEHITGVTGFLAWLWGVVMEILEKILHQIGHSSIYLCLKIDFLKNCKILSIFVDFGYVLNQVINN